MVLAVSKARIPTVVGLLAGSNRRRPRRPSSESHIFAVTIVDACRRRRRIDCVEEKRREDEGLNMKGFRRAFRRCFL